MRRVLPVVLLAVLLGAVPAVAYANIGLPMIALILPPAWSLLLPVVLLEAAVGTVKFAIPFRLALKAQVVANLFSTLVGIPLAWSLLAILELSCCGTALGLQSPWHRIYAVTLQAPWLIPYEGEFWWMIPAASAVLVPLLCVVSIVVEYPIVKRVVGADLAPFGWPWVVRANLLSYLALVAATVLLYRSPWVADTMGALFMPVYTFLVEAVFRVVGATSSLPK